MANQLFDLDETNFIIMVRAASDCPHIIKTYPIQDGENGEDYLSRIMKKKTFKIRGIDDKEFIITFAHRLALTMFLDIDENTSKVRENTFYPCIRLLSNAINLSKIKDYLIEDWDEAHKEEG